MLAIAVVLCNLFLIGCTALVQHWESQTARIPKRKGYNPANPSASFLYLQDFPTIKWGDTIGLSIVDFGVITAIQNNWPLPPAAILSSIGAALLVTLSFHIFSLYFLPYQDSMYPASKMVSWTGKIHLFYMILQLVIVGLGIWALALILAGKREWSPNSTGIILALCGGALYETTWIVGVIAHKRFSHIMRRMRR